MGGKMKNRKNERIVQLQLYAKTSMITKLILMMMMIWGPFFIMFTKIKDVCVVGWCTWEQSRRGSKIPGQSPVVFSEVFLGLETRNQKAQSCGSDSDIYIITLLKS